MNAAVATTAEEYTAMSGAVVASSTVAAAIPPPRTRLANTNSLSRPKRSATAIEVGASSAAGIIRANATTPTAVAPPLRNATTPSAIVNAHSAVQARPNARSARRKAGLRCTDAKAWRESPSRGRTPPSRPRPPGIGRPAPRSGTEADADGGRRSDPTGIPRRRTRGAENADYAIQGQKLWPAPGNRAFYRCGV